MKRNCRPLPTNTSDTKLKNDLNDTLEGLRKEERYKIVETLRSNEFGRTEKVFDSSTEQYFIKKTLRRDSLEEDSRQKIHELLIQLKLSQLARIIDCYSVADVIVIISEYVEGITLLDYVKNSHPIPKQILRQIIDDVFTAIYALHSYPSQVIIHRDITPANIIVYHDEDGLARAKVIDFGIARLFDTDKSSDTRYLGTNGFAAPEQYGFGQTSVRSDIYSLGSVLYYCFTAKNPSNNLPEQLKHDKNLSESARKIIGKALSLNPKDRFASVKELQASSQKLFVTESKSRHKFHLSSFFIMPEWQGLQKNSFLRISWNTILSVFMAILISGAILQVFQAKDNARGLALLFENSLVILFFFPPYFMLLDFFGFYKRFRPFAKFKTVHVVALLVTVQVLYTIALSVILNTIL